MATPADLLWRVNNEYRKRLTQAHTYLELLEQLVLAEGDGVQQHTLAALRFAREQVVLLTEEHRHWRYTYYYDSPESKRMVQNSREVNQALARFSKMRVHHGMRLDETIAALHQSPRPAPELTHLPNGDLWVLAQAALYELSGFDGYVHSLSLVH